MYDALLLDHDGVIVHLHDIDALKRGIETHGAPFFETLGVRPDAELLDVLSIDVRKSQVLELADKHDVSAGALWQCRDDAIETTLVQATRDGQKNPYDDVGMLADVDVPLGVVSNNQRRIVEFMLDYHGLREQFDTVWAREPTIESLQVKKPSPTYLTRAMADLGASRPLFVGDSETDVIGANRAGIDVAYLCREHNAETSLTADPTYDVDGLREVVEILQETTATAERQS